MGKKTANIKTISIAGTAREKTNQAEIKTWGEKDSRKFFSKKKPVSRAGQTECEESH